TAQAVARVLEVPGARHVDFFADGKVAVIGVHVPGSGPPPFAGRPLGEADLPEASRVVAVVRDGAVVGPRRRSPYGPATWSWSWPRRRGRAPGAAWCPGPARSATSRSSGPAGWARRSPGSCSTRASGCG